MFRCLLCLALMCAVFFVSCLVPALAEKRVALVIGNSSYKNTTPLKNPKNDAIAMSSALERLGFVVVKGIDLPRAGFAEVINQFRQELKRADVGLFFYAGHGLQVDGINYLAPTDAKLEYEDSLEFEAVTLNAILRLMERYALTNIVFLDSCRDNPLARNLRRGMGTRSTAIGRGMARVETGIGTIISFATQPGNVALDGNGKHSPFTAAILKHIETPGLDIANLLRAVRRDVLIDTHKRQIPWSNSSLTGPFVFKEKPDESASNSLVKPPSGREPLALAIELAYWQAAEDAGTSEGYNAYLLKYPNGNFSSLVSIKLKELAKKRLEEVEIGTIQQTKQLPTFDSLDRVPHDFRVMTMELQEELKRVGCNPGKIDGRWGRRGRKAMAEFNIHAKLQLSINVPTKEALEAVKGIGAPVCPLVCGVKFKKKGDVCVKKSCASGQTLNSRGHCVTMTRRANVNRVRTLQTKSELRSRIVGARKREPASYTLPYGQTMLIDDGSCPKGKIKQITGGGGGFSRTRRCINR